MKTKYYFIFFVMFTFGSPLIWYLQHELFGGEAACFHDLKSEEHPLGCSTYLQLVASFFIYFLAGIFTLGYFGVMGKWLSIKSSSLILIIISILFAVFRTFQLHKTYSFLKSIQYGLIDPVFPYLVFLLTIYILHRFIAEEKNA